jgi:hypothetical protein
MKRFINIAKCLTQLMKIDHEYILGKTQEFVF